MPSTLISDDNIFIHGQLWIAPSKLAAIGGMGSTTYVRTRDRVDLPRPK
jgi:hypothetical protein